MATKWSRERIIAEIRERHANGLPLTKACKENTRLYLAAQRYFGAWRNAVKAAGITVRLPRTWNRDRVIEAIQDLQRVGMLSGNNIYQIDSGLYVAARKHFGGWPQALIAAGCKNPSRPRHKRTREDVVTAIQDRYRRGLPITGIEKSDRALAKAARRWFGSWRRAVAAAGLEAKLPRQWSRQRVLEEIQRWSQQGVSPTDIWREDLSLLNAANHYFGGWAEAVRAAGFTPKVRRRWSKQRVIDEIRKKHRDGNSMVAVWKEDQALAAAARAYFGGRHDALVAAGLSNGKPRPTRRWTKQRVIAELQAGSRRGLSPTAVWRNNRPLIAAAHRFFGSRAAALEAAGLPSSGRMRWSRQRVIEAILSRHQAGLPMVGASSQDAKLYSAACRYFRSWENAVRAAGLADIAQTLASRK